MNVAEETAETAGCQAICCTQKTKCAVCLEYKHTPLRRDEMGGYVCLTCIDGRLDQVDDELVMADMLYAAALDMDQESRRKIAGLQMWFDIEHRRRGSERRRLRENALAKLTIEERKALGV